MRFDEELLLRVLSKNSREYIGNYDNFTGNFSLNLCCLTINL
jgi:hypothetical protein